MSRSDPKYAAWYELHDLRTLAVAEGRCTSCEMWSGGPTRTPAVYAWTGRNGNTELLCARHCAMWRQFAAEDPTLLPLEIRNLW